MNKINYIFIFLFSFGFLQNLKSMEFERASKIGKTQEGYKYAGFKYAIQNKTGQLLQVERSVKALLDFRRWESIMTIKKDQTIDITDFLKKPSGRFDETMELRLSFPAGAPFEQMRSTVKLRAPLVITPWGQITSAKLRGAEGVIVPIEYELWDGLKKGTNIYRDLAGVMQQPQAEPKKPEVIWFISPEEFEAGMKAFGERHKEEAPAESYEAEQQKGEIIPVHTHQLYKVYKDEEPEEEEQPEVVIEWLVKPKESESEEDSD